MHVRDNAQITIVNMYLQQNDNTSNERILYFLFYNVYILLECAYS